MSDEKHDPAPPDEQRSFGKRRKAADEADLAGVMDRGRPREPGFEGLGEDPGVIEDSTDSAEAHDRTGGPG